MICFWEYNIYKRDFNFNRHLTFISAYTSFCCLILTEWDIPFVRQRERTITVISYTVTNWDKITANSYPYLTAKRRVLQLYMYNFIIILTIHQLQLIKLLNYSVFNSKTALFAGSNYKTTHFTVKCTVIHNWHPSL